MPVGLIRIEVKEMARLMAFALFPIRPEAEPVLLRLSVLHDGTEVSLVRDESKNDRFSRLDAEDWHRAEIYKAVLSGVLIARDGYQRPVPRHAGDIQIGNAFVTVEAFRAYAAGFEICVRVADAATSTAPPPAAPLPEPTPQAAPASEPVTPAARRAALDMLGERGARRRILEKWNDIESEYGPSADGRQVLRVLARNQDEKIVELKTVQNHLAVLRGNGLIP